MKPSSIVDCEGAVCDCARPSCYCSTRELFYDKIPYVFIFDKVLSNHNERWLI
jgi:hypothetical protein